LRENLKNVPDKENSTFLSFTIYLSIFSGKLEKCPKSIFTYKDRDHPDSYNPSEYMDAGHQ
jgi:hypothetical protein